MTMENLQGPISGAMGQPKVETPNSGVTPEDPETKDGQAQESTQIDAGSGKATPKAPEQPAPQSEETFFDPSTLPEELKPAYKQMQAAFTKKMQAIKEQRQKIEAYDAFSRDPVGTLRNIAAQYGMQIVDPRQHSQQSQGYVGQGTVFDNPDYQPQTWGQLANDLSGHIIQQVIKQLAPVIQPLYQNVEQITSKHIESQLDAIDENWRLYEDEIKRNMQDHPSLIRSPDGIKKLYMISVPEDVYRSRIAQNVARRFEDKIQAAKMTTKSSSHASSTPVRKINSFADAVALAKEQLKQQGR